MREWLNQNRGITFGLAACAVAVALFFVVMQVLANRRTITTGLPDAWYTVDDGRTYFAANSANVPPFDYKGKQALRAYVYECGGERFVGYVERFNAEAHKAMTSGSAGPQHQIYGREMKRPGETKWVKSGDFAAVDKMADVRCPHNGAHTPQPVEP